MSEPDADPVPPDPDLPETARRVHDAIQALTDAVSGLTDRIRRSEVRTYVLAGSLILDVLLTVVITAVGFEVSATSNCQAAQNDAFRAAATQLRDAAAKERAAQRALFDVVLDPVSTPEQRRQASVDYRTSLIAADQQRADNPFPQGNCA